jgi:hypothetical protein
MHLKNHVNNVKEYNAKFPLSFVCGYAALWPCAKVNH